MKVIVSSTNPVKINASKSGFEQVFPGQEINLTSVSVPSGVPDQPGSDLETLTGATNRVENAANLHQQADFWIGLEGGIDLFEDQIYSFAWIVVKSKDGKIGRSRTANFALPDSVVSKIKEGYELGTAMDMVYSQHNSKQNQGAVGIISDDLIVRETLYIPSVILALKTLK